MNILLYNNIYILIYTFMINYISFLLYGSVEKGLIRHLSYNEDITDYLLCCLFISFIISITYFFIGQRLRICDSVIKNCASIFIIIILTLFTIKNMLPLKVLLMYAFSPLVYGGFTSSYSCLLILIPFISTLLGMKYKIDKSINELVISYYSFIAIIYIISAIHLLLRSGNTIKG